MAKQFIFLHGWSGNDPGHWMEWLRDELTEAGHTVYLPEFSDPDTPELSVWLEELGEVLDQIDSQQPLVIIAHSLGAALWLHYRKRNPSVVADTVMLVAPTPNDCGIPEITEFFPLPDLQPNVDTEYIVIGSDDDPYIDEEYFEDFADALGGSFELIEDGGHFNVDAGYGPWPWMLEQCLE